MKVTICLIATRKYKSFVGPLLEDIKEYFLKGHFIDVWIFTDEIKLQPWAYQKDERVTINQELIPSYGFPEATLLRYQIMCSREYNTDYLFYLDVDYRIVSTVTDEFLGNVVAVLHPGFSCVGGGSWCTDKKSNAYTYPEFRKQYFCGGTQGGKYEYYYPIMKRLAREITDDEKRGVRCEWNDEQHWNKFLSEYKEFKILDSSYCMVEEQHLRERWKLTHLTPKIIALKKNHQEIRS